MISGATGLVVLCPIGVAACGDDDDADTGDVTATCDAAAARCIDWGATNDFPEQTG